MNGLTAPIVLQLLGVLVVIAEIILPSGGLLSLVAIAVFGYSLYLVFETVSPTMGMIFVLADMLMLPALIVAGLKLLAKSPVTLRTELSKGDGVTSQAADLADYLHKSGKALTALRPAGMAEIEGRRLDVVSRGEFIEKGARLAVITVTGNQIIVARLEETELADDPARQRDAGAEQHG